MPLCRPQGSALLALILPLTQLFLFVTSNAAFVEPSGSVQSTNNLSYGLVLTHAACTGIFARYQYIVIIVSIGLMLDGRVRRCVMSVLRYCGRTLSPLPMDLRHLLQLETGVRSRLFSLIDVPLLIHATRYPGRQAPAIVCWWEE